MLRLLTTLCACLLMLGSFSTAPAEAQPQDEADRLNQRAIEALQAKRFDEGITLLQKRLELRPKDNGTAYNLACAYSLKNEADKAFEWLDKGIDWGWGAGTGTLVANPNKQMTHVEMTRNDPDFENIRLDPRFEKTIERMQKVVEQRAARLKLGEEYAAQPAIYIPEKIAGLAEKPVLVVLHDAGKTKKQVLEGRWKAIADELGLVLIAPSGKYPIADEPDQGMAWFDDLGAYSERPWTFEKPIDTALTVFKKEHKLDRTRVFIAGEGFGGMVALSVGVSSPGLYKGVVALNSLLPAPMLNAKAPNAGKMGLKLRLFVDEAMKFEGVPEELTVASLVENWSKQLKTWGIPGAVETFTSKEGEPDPISKLVVDALTSFLPQATPVPAAGEGGGK